MPANLENSAVATGLEKLSFHSNPKERQCQRMLKLQHNCTHLSLVQSLSRVGLLVTPWTAAHQAPPSMEFSRQEYWSGLPFTSPRSLPDTRIEPGSPSLRVKALSTEPPGNPTLAK